MSNKIILLLPLELSAHLFCFVRERLSISQTQFAQLLGCSRSQLSMIELGTRSAPIELIKKLVTLSRYSSLEELIWIASISK